MLGDFVKNSSTASGPPPFAKGGKEDEKPPKLQSGRFVIEHNVRYLLHARASYEMVGLNLTQHRIALVAHALYRTVATLHEAASVR